MAIEHDGSGKIWNSATAPAELRPPAPEHHASIMRAARALLECRHELSREIDTGRHHCAECGALWFAGSKPSTGVPLRIVALARAFANGGIR